MTEKGILMTIDRRRFICAATSALGLPVAFAQDKKDAKGTRIVLLGTKGGPTPSKTRAPASAVLIVAGKPYLIDCPDGTARNVPPASQIM